MSGPILEAKALTKDYGRVRAVGPLDAVLGEGAWGLLGPNGAGKSTLILLALGLRRATGGSVRILGLDPAADPRAVRARVGFVPEGEAFVPGHTGVGFVALCGRLSGLDRKSALSRAHEMLDHVGLGEARYRKVSEYSTGMRQRAKLAAALVHDPDLLILDEPTNGLDPNGRRAMLELLREVRKSGVNLVYASHVLAEVEEVCDNLLILDRGRGKYHGTLSDFVATADRTYDVRFAGGDARVVEGALAKAGVRVVELHTEGAETRARLVLPEQAREDLVLRAVRDGGGRLRGLVAARESLEAGFVRSLEATGAATPAQGRGAKA